MSMIESFKNCEEIQQKAREVQLKTERKGAAASAAP
jgi:hypothetical protein